jgi:NADH-quinone oxidoreductase subunit H
MCLLLSLLFLGGWNGLEIYLLGDLAPAISLYLKTIVLMMILVFLRSIYPRLRLDQAVRVGWSSLLSLSLISLTVAGIVKFIGWF